MVDEVCLCGLTEPTQGWPCTHGGCHFVDLDKDKIEKLEKKNLQLENTISELKRTRAEAEAQAMVAGYKDGQRDMRASLRGLLGDKL